MYVVVPIEMNKVFIKSRAYRGGTFFSYAFVKKEQR